MPDPTPTTPPAVPPKVVTDLSEALVSEQPSDLAAPVSPGATAVSPTTRKPPPQAPTDGSERHRNVGKDAKDDRDFFDKLYKHLDGMRIENADTRALKLVVQAMVGRILDSYSADLPAVETPPAPPAK